MKKILATLIALITMFQFANVDAAAIDNELAILAAEQDTQNAAPKKVEEVKKPVQKSKQEIEAEKKRLREEQKAAEKKLKEEQKAARKQIEEGKKEVVKLSDSNRNSRTSRTSTGESSRVEKNPAVNTSSNVTPANSNTARTSTPTDSTARNNVNSNTNTSTSSGGNSNLVRDYASFDEVTKAVGFTPLYIPKKSGYTVTTISVVGERMAQIKYGRRWEPEVSLYIRTYKRLPNEELKDISGINGVKWRVDMTGGTTVYVAKLSDTAHAAAWAVGEYTFAAYAENLSFAAFHALVVEELVDLSSHYYTN